MNLKNKDIMEGMRVINGKDKLKVISWDKSYEDCLLNYLDSKGNRYVIAQDYELSGTEKDPQIFWVNGRYFTANSDYEAFEEYLDYLGKVNEYDISESLKEYTKKYLVKGLDVDFVVDHLLSLEDSDNFDLINKLRDLWEVYTKSWNKFNNVLSDFWKVMKDIEKLNSFDKTCKEIVDAWYDDIKKIFYSNDNPENFKLNYGFKGNDIFKPKKSLRKSLKESSKPINEKNVAKFVDELNKFCDEKIHYVDSDAEKFTKKYGKLYNFKYRFDDTDKMFVIYDSEGILDMFDDNANYVREEIDRIAKKNGWYADPYTSSNNFTFGEI